MISKAERLLLYGIPTLIILAALGKTGELLLSSAAARAQANRILGGVFAIAIFGFAASLNIYDAVGEIEEGKTYGYGRKSDPVERAASPKLFWVSIIVKFLFAVGLLTVGLYGGYECFFTPAR